MTEQLSATHTTTTHTHNIPFPEVENWTQKECCILMDYFLLGPSYGGPGQGEPRCHKLQRLIPTVIIPHFPSNLAIHFLGHRTCPYTLIPCWPLCRLRPRLVFLPLRMPKSRQAQSQNIPLTNNMQSFLGYNHTPCLWPQEKVTIRLRISCLSPCSLPGPLSATNELTWPHLHKQGVRNGTLYSVVM